MGKSVILLFLCSLASAGPVLDFISNKDVNEGQALTFDINATDDNSVIVYSANSLPKGSTFIGHTFSWDCNQARNYLITFIANDGELENTQDVNITVHGLVANWKMDDDTNSTVVIDSNGYSNGTATRDSCDLHITGQVGGGMAFNIPPATLTVSGNLGPDGLSYVPGVYTFTGEMKHGKPRYICYREDLAPGFYWELFWEDNNHCWFIGSASQQQGYWVRYDTNILGTYEPIMGSEGVATVSGSPLRMNDYVDSNLADPNIWRHDFTVCWWMKTQYFHGSSFSFANNNSGLVDISCGFVGMSDSNGRSFAHSKPIPDSYSDKWTMFTATVEQTAPAIVTAKQYLNNILLDSNLGSCDLSRWSVQESNGSPSAVWHTPYIGAYNYAGDLVEIMGYGYGAAYKDVRIYNKALSSNEVALLYNSSRENPLSDCNDVQDANYGLLSDLNGDCYVDCKDLKIVADNWLNECSAPDNCGGADFAPTNGTVDFADFSKFAEQWMQCNVPNEPDCIINW